MVYLQNYRCYSKCMSSVKEYIVTTPDDFQSIISAVLQPQDEGASVIIALRGDLGAGKTAFVQQLAKYFGLEENVSSPTFTIMKKYELPHPKFKQLIHIDAYRIESEHELGPLQFSSVLHEPKSVVCIEWPEKISSAIPQSANTLELTINKDESRTARLQTTYE